MAVVRHVLQQAVPLHAAASLTLHVHPDDLAALKADPAFETWLARREAGSALRLAGDSSLRLGGVLLRSQHGSLDARMETQLQSLKSMLLQTRRDEPGRVPGGTANAARRGVRRAAPGAHAPLAEGEPQ
jgi:flagellar assembly protein FliH